MSVPIVDTARAEGLHQKLSYAGHHKDVHSLVPQTEQQKYVHPLKYLNQINNKMYTKMYSLSYFKKINRKMYTLSNLKKIIN